MAIPLGSVAASLGSALGTGLSEPIEQGLQLLAQNKLAQIQRAQYARGLTPVLGEKVASFLSNLGPDERKAALQNIGSLMQFQGEPTGFPQSLQQPQLGQQQEQIPSDRSKLIQDIFTSPHERREEEKLALRRQQLAQQEKQAAFKETKPERKEILTSSKSARENIARLNRMEELSNKGKLDNPLYLEALKKIGLDIPALTTPDSQEFRKLETDFLRDAKNIFGSRVTNFEMSQFLKAIPSLSQSKEGRSRVIRNLKIFNEAAFARSKAMKEIIKDNKGIPPFDLAEQIEEKSGPQIDLLMKDFYKGQDIGTTAIKETAAPKEFILTKETAAKFKDKKVRENKTGKLFKSDGVEWVELKEEEK